MSRRPPSKPRFMEKADRAFSKYIRARDGKCLSCGSSEFLQCAHLITRSYKSIRVNELNAVALCRSCHVKYTHKPLEWRQWVETRYPGRWDELKGVALEYGKVDWQFQARYWTERVKQVNA